MLRVDRLKIYRNNLLIGFGGIAICGVVPRVLALFWIPETNWEAHTYCTHLSIITPQLLYYVFIARLTRPWRLKYRPHELILAGITLIHILIYIGTLVVTLTDQKVHEGSKVFNLLVTPLLFATGFVDFLAILMGGLGWRNGTPLKKIVIDFMDASPPKPSECEICTLDYTTTRPPRVLTKCGHTICQPCATRFLENFTIICPFCRRTTDQIKKVEDLPKNWTALEMIKKSCFKCKICKLNFSENRIPRVLTTCGHSICESCAEGKIRYDKQIACPYCKALTGGVYRGKQLPKNYAALELVKEYGK
ncbi:unnamed protein product [Caenorhabditis brenneri]